MNQLVHQLTMKLSRSERPSKASWMRKYDDYLQWARECEQKAQQTAKDLETKCRRLKVGRKQYEECRASLAQEIEKLQHSVNELYGPWERTRSVLEQFRSRTERIKRRYEEAQRSEDRKRLHLQVEESWKQYSNAVEDHKRIDNQRDFLQEQKEDLERKMERNRQTWNKEAHERERSINTSLGSLTRSIQWVYHYTYRVELHGRNLGERTLEKWNAPSGREFRDVKQAVKATLNGPEDESSQKPLWIISEPPHECGPPN